LGVGRIAVKLLVVANIHRLQPLGDPSSRSLSGIFEKRDYPNWRGHKRAFAQRQLVSSFSDLGVRPHACRALDNLGIDDPTPVQAAAIPPLLSGKDCVIQSPTGSGKTLAFLVPMAQKLRGHAQGAPRALIVTPTRELATQIGAVLTRLDPQLRMAMVFGGVAYGKQIGDLRTADVIIGCPGRLVDLAKRGSAVLGAVEYLVLDEADEMLDAGFAKDVEDLADRTNRRTTQQRRQTVLASATMPEWVEKLARKHLVEPAQVAVAPNPDSDLEHGLMMVQRAQKVAVLSQLLRHSKSTIVFHRTKHGAKKLARDLTALGHQTAELQGNLSQPARDRAMASFRRRDTNVLVATNVAARGIDVVDVNLVVNYELPDTALWLTHRVGRTARNGAKGKAVTFLSEDDAEKWRKLRKLGAPEIQFIDADHLLTTGTMKFVGSQLAPSRGNTQSPVRHVPGQGRSRIGGRSFQPRAARR
jgi:ATP-dependent RNA helicase RhlE